MGNGKIYKSNNVKKKLSEAIFLIRRITYLSISIVDRYTHNKNRIFILSYHSIHDDNWRFSINYKEFVRQIDYLLKYFEPISLDDIRLLIQGKKEFLKPSFVITFDDGYEDILKIRKYLAEKGIRPALFLISDCDNVDRKELDTDRAFISTKDINSLVCNGWILGCHSATHADFSNLSPERIDYEVIDSKKCLEKKLGCKINYFAYPKGKYSKEILNSVKKAGYRLALSMDDGFVFCNTNPSIVPRIGVDRTHTFGEFKTLFLPSVVMFKNLIKRGMKLI